MTLNIASVDLRLLRLFDALLSQRSVSRAAFQVGMTQPAASNALNRLRALTGDQLFVRTGDGMKPTPLSLRIGPLVGDALRKLEFALRLDDFDPATAKDVLRLAVSDHAAVVFLPRLLVQVQKAAPEVTLRVEPKSNSEIEAKLDRNEVDLAIGVIPQIPKRFRRQALFDDRYVLLMRRGHPLRRAKIDAATIANAQNLAVRPAYSMESGIDQLFRRHGYERRIQLSTSQFLAVPEIVRKTDLIGAAFLRMTDCLDLRGISVMDVPLPKPLVQVSAVWARDMDGDPARVWLREQMALVAANMPRGIRM